MDETSTLADWACKCSHSEKLASLGPPDDCTHTHDPGCVYQRNCPAKLSPKCKTLGEESAFYKLYNIFEVVCYVDKDRPKIYTRSGLQPTWLVYVSFYYFSLLFQFPELLLSIYWVGKGIPPPAHQIDHDTKRDGAQQVAPPGLEYRTGSHQSFLCLSHLLGYFFLSPT